MADDKLAPNHERIWLQPLCCVGERCWCEHPQDCGDEGCGLPAIEYVRADLVATAIDNARAMNREMLAALKRLLTKFENCARHAGNDAETIAAATEFAREAIKKAESGGRNG